MDPPSDRGRSERRETGRRYDVDFVEPQLQLLGETLDRGARERSDFGGLPISVASNLSEYSRGWSMISWNEPRIGIDRSTCPRGTISRAISATRA